MTHTKETHVSYLDQIALLKETNIALLEACKDTLTEWTLHGALTDTARTLKKAIKQAEET